jgi:hypothetical protein
MEGLVENATPYMMSWDTLRSLCVVEGIKPSRRRKSRMINALRKVDKLPSGFDAWCSHQQEEEAEEESEEEQEKAGDEEMAEEEEGEQENSGDEQKASSSSSHSSSSSCDSLDSSAASSQAESVESVESAEEGLRRTMLKAVGVKRRARTRSARRTNTAKTSFLTDPGTVGQGPRKLLELELGSQIIRVSSCETGRPAGRQSSLYRYLSSLGMDAVAGIWASLGHCVGAGNCAGSRRRPGRNCFSAWRR